METFFKFMVAGILALLAIVGFLFIMSMPVSAHVLTPDECRDQAQDVGFLHDVKQTGLPWEQAKSLIEKDVALAFAKGDTYVKDSEDVQRLMDIAQYVWASKESKADLQMAAWYGCLMKWEKESF